jgi:trimethylamine:corrinoid methyltransferase-like protein
VIDRASLDGWKGSGARSAVERASERVKKLVDGYRRSPIPDGLRAELRAITTRAAQKFGMEKLPPLPDAGAR